MSGDVVIAAPARTPFGRFGGALRDVSAPELGAFAIDTVIARAGLPPDAVEGAYIGVGMIGSGMLTPVRQAVLRSKLRQETPSFGVDRACCSGMTAVGLAFKDIKAGEASLLIAGGFESLSRTPQLLPRNHAHRVGRVAVDDPLMMRGEVVEVSISGYTAREALQHGIDRVIQDEWALQSHERYFAADAKAFFDAERVTFVKDTIRLEKDEAPRRDTSLEKLGKLRTVYDSETVTAGNAPGLSDGAAAMVVALASAAKAGGLDVQARMLAYAQVCGGPTSGSYTPAVAIWQVLRKADVRLEDVALIEINEAFAATPLVSTLKLANGDKAGAERLRARTNVYGGAIAIGHPLGASGARLVMTLAAALRTRGGGLGVAAICGGFGQGDAILIKVDG
jgi:acetyl-CoA C-acetyltransferase